MTSLAACAPRIEPIGAVAWPADAHSFLLGAPPAGYEGYGADAAAAVRDALIGKGYAPAEDARYRVDVGFAVGSTSVEVVQPGDPKAKEAAPRIALCKPRKYVLSVAMIDRRTGHVLFRAGAATARCGDISAKLLPELARVALR
ncbi:hypothetical protein BH09PSE4_BH09PSE4_12780 [soil metagenome]